MMSTLSAALFLSAAAPSHAAHQPIVDALVTTVNTNSTFRSGLEVAVSWYASYTHQPNYSLDDLYTFFDGYIFSFPSPEDPYGYLGPLYPMFISNPDGASLIANQPLAGWIEKLFTARAEYLSEADSTSGIAPYLARPDVINMSDFVIPPDGYASFQDFFGRPLAAGVRPISRPDDDAAAVSPCDCQVTEVFQNTNLSAPFLLKGGTLDVDTLLGHDPIAAKFAGGTSILLHLNLTDYHRYHAPVSGTVTHMEMLGGIYLGQPYGPGWFYPFHRGAVIVDSPVAGLVAMVPVGMFDVGSVILDSRVNSTWQKGKEVGHFAFGGSAIMVVFGPQVAVTDLPEKNDMMKMGGPLATLTPVMSTNVV
jgi:phosphatidylserine decarboxylase